MNVDESPDRVELLVELGRLNHREAAVARQLERSKHRAAMFPSDFVLAELRKLTVEHHQIVTRREELEALLQPAADTSSLPV